MLVYIAMTVISMALAHYCVPGTTDRSKIPFIQKYLPILPFLLVSMFRYGMGTDYLHIYVNAFDSFKEGITWGTEWLEPGYALINHIALWLGLDSFAVFAVMAGIFNIFIYKYILDRSSNVAMSMLILFVGQLWLFSLNALRQTAAIAICIFATKYCDEKDIKRYMVLVCLAASIHSTALIFVPLYFILRKHFSQVVIISISVLLLIVSNFAPQLFEWVSVEIFGRDPSYFSNNYYKGRLYYVEFAFALFFTIAVMIYENDLIKMDCGRRSIVNLMYLGLLAASSSAAIPNAERFDFYFFGALISLIPGLSYRNNGNKVAFLPAIVFVGLLGARLLYDTYIGGDSNGIAEYVSVLSIWF